MKLLQILGLSIFSLHPSVADLSFCDGQHQAWSTCVNSANCTSCLTHISPSTCDDFEVVVCEAKSCCPRCESILSAEYIHCAVTEGHCSSPTCDMLASNPLGGNKSSLAVCAVYLRGYTNCLQTFQNNGGADFCQHLFDAYDTCVGGLGISNPAIKITGIGWCSGLHASWKNCVNLNGCVECPVDEPTNCGDFGLQVCEKVNCCPPCSSLITNSYAPCVQQSECKLPQCALTQPNAASNSRCHRSTSFAVAVVVAGAGVLALM